MPWEAGKNLSQIYRNHQNLPRNDCTKVSRKAGYHLCTEPPSSDERNVRARRTAEAAPPRRARAACSKCSAVLPDMDERHAEVQYQVGKGGGLELVCQFHTGSMYLEITGSSVKAYHAGGVAYGPQFGLSCSHVCGTASCRGRAISHA